MGPSWRAGQRRWSYDDHRYAGRIGSQIARLAVENGYNVVISNSRGPETLSALISELGPKAYAATAVEAAKAGDIVVVSVPLKDYRKVPVEPLAGKIVIDTDNYYPERDGHIPELDNESTTTSELLQAHLPTSNAAKELPEGSGRATETTTMSPAIAASTAVAA